jgi:4'-phosphopantetheinyl transferase
MAQQSPLSPVAARIEAFHLNIVFEHRENRGLVVSAGNWVTPLADIALHLTEVHIWRAGLELPESMLGQLATTLASDEGLRASGFRFSRDRNRYIAARGILRLLLGRYLARDPAEIQFEYGSHGKPRVAHTKNRARLDFNLAHSDDLALFAFGLGRKIGIDIERERPIDDMPQLVSRNFSARESATWHALPKGKRRSAFFNCWVRKEAFVKAVGDGLSYPLQEFDVAVSPAETPGLLAVSGSAELARMWSLMAVDAAPGFAGAVVAEGSDWQTLFLQFG